MTKALVLKDAEAHHDINYLQKLIEEVLKEYKIGKEQILHIVTGNASKLLR